LTVALDERSRDEGVRFTILDDPQRAPFGVIAAAVQ
jgi:hypothetical protein